MLFYASLFLFCVALSAVSLWLYRSLTAVGKAVYRAFLPSSKSNRLARKSAAGEEAATYNNTLVPWGWGPGDNLRRTHAQAPPPRKQAKAAVPWGWPGNGRNSARIPTRVPVRMDAELVEAVKDEPESPEHHVGWPYREEAFEFAGRTYRVQQATGRVGKKNLGGVVRPWGW